MVLNGARRRPAEHEYATKFRIDQPLREIVRDASPTRINAATCRSSAGRSRTGVVQFQTMLRTKRCRFSPGDRVRVAHLDVAGGKYRHRRSRSLRRARHRSLRIPRRCAHLSRRAPNTTGGGERAGRRRVISAAGSNRVNVVHRKFIGLLAARRGSSVKTTSGHPANAGCDAKRAAASGSRA